LKTQNPTSANVKWAVLALVVSIMIWPRLAMAVGTWVPLANQAPLPPGGQIDTMLLLSDGTVMCATNSTSPSGWYRLTPDNHGSYINGTWTQLASENYSRSGFASDVLPDGRVFVAGGEYGTGTAKAEIYDPVANTWTEIDPPSSLLDPAQDVFSDAISVVIANGTVMIMPVHPKTYGGTLIYDPVAKAWSPGPVLANNAYYQEECSWAKLADGSIITIDPSDQKSQRYVPSLNQWVPDADVPVNLWSFDGVEIGAALTLPNGKAFFFGADGTNAIYTAGGATTNQGVWTAAAVTPGGFGLADVPAAMMNNGKILCATGTNCGNGGCQTPPWRFYEYDYTVGSGGSFTLVSNPLPPNSAPGKMLDLPDGTVLLSYFNTQLYVYVPDGSPLVAGKPTISSITQNADGSYHLVGTGLNGISEGATYGDDAQMNSNYPLVRMTNGFTGNVYYARTYNWSSTGIQTGDTPITTEFALPPGLPPGKYSLVVVANGITSDSLAFYVGPAFTNLVEFDNVPNAIGGLNPNGLCKASDGNFYGTTYGGGMNGNGILFKMTADGTLTPLAQFDNTAGRGPSAVTQGADGKLFGTTASGGANVYGTVFQATTNGLLSALFSFGYSNNCGCWPDGETPEAPLAQGNDGNFYGTTTSGGTGATHTYGVVFCVTTNGTLTNVVTFNGTNGGGPGPSGLVLAADGNFYGTTVYGGSTYNFSGGNLGDGTVFQLTTKGTLNTLVSFYGANGRGPVSGVVQGKDGNLYGTTQLGGQYGNGTVFQLQLNGSVANLNTLHSFAAYTALTEINIDGAIPNGRLLVGADGNLYGTTTSGGAYGNGTIFQIQTDGTLTTLHTFTGGSDGANPESALVQGNDGNFYGASFSGGTYRFGTIFRLSIAPSPPIFQAVTQTNGTLTLNWSAESGQLYQLAYSTNLTQTNWNNLGGPINASNATVTAFETIGPDRQRFYRVLRLP
jgi:uncharacterized repeat protein (TIGR03803 family)